MIGLQNCTHLFTIYIIYSVAYAKLVTLFQRTKYAVSQISGISDQISKSSPPILLGDPHCICLDCCVDYVSCRRYHLEIHRTRFAKIYY